MTFINSFIPKSQMEEDSMTISTDMKSDISFMNRQKELRNVYREFRAALDNIHSSIGQDDVNDQSNITQDTEKYQDMGNNDNDSESAEEDEISTNVFEKRNEVDDIDPDIEIILQEIELLQSETEEIIDLLSKPKFSKNSRVAGIMKQLRYLQHVNQNLKARAENLME